MARTGFPMGHSSFVTFSDPSGWEPLKVSIPRIKSSKELAMFVEKYPLAFGPKVNVELASKRDPICTSSPPISRSLRSTLIYPMAIALGLRFPLCPLVGMILQQLGIPIEHLVPTVGA